MNDSPTRTVGHLVLIATAAADEARRAIKKHASWAEIARLAQIAADAEREADAAMRAAWIEGRTGKSGIDK